MIQKKLSTHHQAKRMVGLTTSLIVLMAVSASPSHACTLPKSYYKHVSCTASSSYFLAVKDSGAPVALIGKDGKQKLDLSRYTQVDASKLKEGLMPVQRAGKVGYVNMQGREIVPAIYDVIIGDVHTSGWARAASGGRIVVKKGGKFGVINTAGKVIVPFANKYRSIQDFKGGFAQVLTAQGSSRIDINGKTVASPPSQPPKRSDEPPTQPATVPASAQNPYTPQPPQTASSVGMNSASSLTPWQPIKRDGKWGYVNEAGVPMITFSFDDAMPFSEGLAGVRVANNWGFINLAGDLVIPFRFDEAGVIRDGELYQGQLPFKFVQGKAWVGNLNNGMKLCIDKQGTNVTCGSPDGQND